MKQILLSSLLLLVVSCKSEYEERLEIAQSLKGKLELLNGNDLLRKELLNEEILEIKKEIQFHAKVSGNETLFFEELDLTNF